MTSRDPQETVEATAGDYIEHAKEINAIARTTLRLDTHDASWLAGKISIGLSLQSGELAGKAILRSLGHSVEQIRKEHARHDLLTLLRQAEKELQARPVRTRRGPAGSGLDMDT